MNSGRPWFPSLCVEAPLADVQVRQTLAMGLVPLGLALLLGAAGSPRWPPPGVWAGGAGALGGMALLWSYWRRCGGRRRRGFSTTHFLVRYLFIVLCPALLWVVFGQTILDLAGLFPPVLMVLLLALYPVSRLLRERVGPDPRQALHVEMAYLICVQIEMILGVFALVGVVSGAILDANRDYPTDPAPLLIVIWMLGGVAVLVGAVRGAVHWGRLYAEPAAPQPLDDPPPPSAAAGTRMRFGSEKF